MMKAYFGGILVLALALAGCNDQQAGSNMAAAGNTVAPAPITAPNGDWSQVVAATPEGGFVMGNPNAPVKLVEFASMTCHVCQEFSVQGVADLTDKYVKSGQVSFELRNFIRDGADLAAALVARCGGATPYFKLTEQMFATQPDWIAKLQKMTPAQNQALSTASPQQASAMLADAAGFVQFAKVRGIPEARARACLADEQALEKLVNMNTAAMEQFKVEGTPTFVINGKVVPNAVNWAALEPAIQAAIG